MILISWLKSTHGLLTGLNENNIREIGFKNKLLDIKI